MATFQALTNQPNGLTNISASDILSIGLAIVSGTGTPATSGLVRAANNTTIISARNAANSANMAIVQTDSANNITIGDGTNSAAMIIYSNSLTEFIVNSTLTFSTGTTYIQSFVSNFVFNSAVSNPNITHGAIVANGGTGQGLTLRAQDVSGTGTTTGGALDLQSGSGGTIDGNVYLRTGNTVRVTVTPSLVISALPIALQGSNSSTTGDIRSSNNTTIISARNAANSNNIPVIATDSSNQILIGDAAQTGGLNLSSSNQLNTISASVLIRDTASATAITIIPVPAGATSMTVAAGVTSFIFSQSTKTSDAVPVNFTIRPQAPFSTATGANRVPGSLIADIGVPTNSGTSEGRLTITRASTFSASIGPYESAGGSYSAIYLGPGLTPSSSNFTVLSNGSSVTYLNAPSGGTIALSFNGATATGMILTANLLQWATATTTPLINQADVTTNSATGTTLTLQSQNATGTTSTGGGLTLTSGTGTTVAGNLLLQTGGSTKLTISPTLITAALPIVLQGTNSAASGDIRASKGFQFAARNQTNTGDNSVLFDDSGNGLIVGGSGYTSSTLRATTTTATVTSGLITINGALVLQGTNPATTGDIRAANNTTIIAARNAANSADMSVIRTDGSDDLVVGQTTQVTAIYLDAKTGGGTVIRSNGVSLMTITAASAAITVPLTLQGTNFATTGDVRAVNNTTIIAARNAANSANITVLKTDASDQITIGDTTNTAGVFLTANSSTGTIRSHGTTIIGDPDTTARLSITPGATTTMAVAASVTSFSLLQTTSATGNGVNMTIQAQSGLVDGNPRNGGKLILLGGAKNSTGLKGGLKLALNADVANEILIELVEIASSRRIVAINRGVPLTTTEMPSNTGDLVCYVGNASTVPSASPVSGGILYSDQGAGKWYGTSGTVTTFGPAEPHCPRCGRDYAFEAKNTRLNEHLAICWACFTDEAAAHGMNVSNFAFIRQLNES